MSLMASGCCCSPGNCSCPPETDLPSSVLVTITVTGCSGTTAVFAHVAQLNASAACEIGACLCSKYSFNANTNTPNCSGYFLCNMQEEIFDYCNYAGEATIGVSSIGLGTNGTGFTADPYVTCDLWVIRINFAVWGGRGQFDTIQVSSDVCTDCYVRQFYPESPCSGISVSTIDEVLYCKSAGQSPIGTYESCVGMPHEFCSLEPLSCEACFNTPPYIGIVINDITVA